MARKHPWPLAALWLCGLGPFFYASYGFANYLADRRGFVPSFAFGWEQHIPFLAWTIIPYWSLNLFYAACLFVCTTRREVNTLGRRLLTAQIVAVGCFIVFPLRFSFARPAFAGDGVSGFLFDALLSFDKPYNQAPSLHIALLAILWGHYRRHSPGWLRPLLHAWYALIGVSVLTTYQHHFIDIPTGALLGCFCLWLWPDRSSRAEGLRGEGARKRVLALFYASGAAVLAAAGLFIGNWGLLLCYPALSLALVACNYRWRGAAGFQKREDGSMPLAARILFAPYQAGAFLNSRWWTRKAPWPVEVAEGVFLGRLPSRLDRNRRHFDTVVDMAAELPASTGGGRVHAVPMLDLVAPLPEQLDEAVGAIEKAKGSGTVLVCCALGYSRSAASLAAWLLRSGRAGTVEEAVAILRGSRPSIVLRGPTLDLIAAAGRRPR